MVLYSEPQFGPHYIAVNDCPCAVQAVFDWLTQQTGLAHAQPCVLFHPHQRRRKCILAPLLRVGYKHSMAQHSVQQVRGDSLSPT